jgi:hypothetical protein
MHSLAACAESGGRTRHAGDVGKPSWARSWWGTSSITLEEGARHRATCAPSASIARARVGTSSLGSSCESARLSHALPQCNPRHPLNPL